MRIFVAMDKNRLEAFTDGIIAIIITIMILELKVPHNPTWKNYLEMYPVFLSYALSFVFAGLYWSIHHHLFHKVKIVNNKVLWANMTVLFWLSILPSATAAMGENSFSSITVAIYASILVLVNIFYIILVNELCKLHGSNSEFSKTVKGHPKSYITIAFDSFAAILSLLGLPKIAFLLLILISLSWLIQNHKSDK